MRYVRVKSKSFLSPDLSWLTPALQAEFAKLQTPLTLDERRHTYDKIALLRQEHKA